MGDLGQFGACIPQGRVHAGRPAICLLASYTRWLGPILIPVGELDHVLHGMPHQSAWALWP